MVILLPQLITTHLRHFLLFVVECTLADLWEEWDRGFVIKLAEKRTQPLQYLCSLSPKEQERWRGTTGSSMRTMLLRRKCLWIEMQSVFDNIDGDAEDKVAAMLSTMGNTTRKAQEELGLSKLPSNNQFADYLKSKNKKR